MHLCLIAAMSENRVIWHQNELPRDIPEDLKRFRALTRWCPVVMWRNTYESIGKPLPGRRNIVISKSSEFPEVEHYDDPDQAIAVLDDELEEADPIFIIWWATLYTYFLDQAEYIYMTHIHDYYQWDVYFPTFEEHFEVIEKEEHPHYDFVTYRKKWQE